MGAGEMDQADAELRATICKVWPYEGKDKVDLLVPPQEEIGKGKLTVGRIYGGLLILENWKTTKFGRIPNSQRPKGSLLQQIMGLSSGASMLSKNTKLDTDAALLISEATKVYPLSQYEVWEEDCLVYIMYIVYYIFLLATL